jgi:hypothetical protein
LTSSDASSKISGEALLLLPLDVSVKHYAARAANSMRDKVRFPFNADNPDGLAAVATDD